LSADPRPLAIAVLGPTASGKTAFALELAHRLGGEIVSVDSALVYRGLDIGAAKPTDVERQGIPHHLIDIREPWQPYSAAEFVADARAAIDGILARGRMPILAGGTSLYVHALFNGLAEMPSADPGVREELTRDAEAQGWPALHARLREVDPDAAARIHATDAQRIQRALEVFRITGRPISAWQREGTARPRLSVRTLKVVLAPSSREVLRARIDARFDAMLAAGFLDEVRHLRRLPGIAGHASPSDLPALRAVGYRQGWEHLEGRTDAAGFREAAIFATRHLAKRQLTWLRGQLDLRWFDPLEDRAALEDAVELFLAGSRHAAPEPLG